MTSHRLQAAVIDEETLHGADFIENRHKEMSQDWNKLHCFQKDKKRYQQQRFLCSFVGFIGHLGLKSSIYGGSNGTRTDWQTGAAGTIKE